MKQLFTYLLLVNALSGYSQQRYDILITEFMADPSPAVGLPSYEWIEIRNVSSAAIQLQGWRLGDASSLSGPLPAFLVQPDSFLILCPASALNSMSSFGNAIAVPGFPSIDNEGGTIFIQTQQGRTIHGLEYHVSWYRNALKQEGGWSLEMADPSNHCSGKENWSASTDMSGGTPGRKNATDASNPDTRVSHLLFSYTKDSSNIIMVFDEPLDSISASDHTHYHIDGGLSVDSATLLPHVFSSVRLHTSTPLIPDHIYAITVNNVMDCSQAMISPVQVKTGLPASASAGDCIINEILFNPRSGGNDFAEIYNRSDKILDISTLYVTNRNAGGNLGVPRQISVVARYLFPDEYIVVTPEAEQLGMHYLVKNPGQVFDMPSFPSLPDDEGTIVLMNAQGDILDEVHYADDWHFKLVSNAEGISLERIDPGAESQQAQNWHSAASTAGYGTPTYRNSQYMQANTGDGTFEIKPGIFSPDNDGRDDLVSFFYRLEKPGYMANIIIYDIAGRPVRHLVKNELAAVNGNWNWDGLGEDGKKLPVNRYIVYASFFNPDGKKLKYKKTVVLGK